MAVTIKTNFTRDIPSRDEYRIDIEIIDATGIDLDVLVFDAETDVFSRVATVYDMETYPDTKDVTLAYYRGRKALGTFSDSLAAENFESITKSRLNSLATQWDIVKDTFPGTVVHTATSDS